MKLNFTYSEVYDEILSAMSEESYNENQALELKQEIQKLNDFWNKKGSKFISTIENSSKLKFSKDIDCYIVKNLPYIAFSNPLTVKADKNINRTNITLVHELIHDLFVQNQEQFWILEEKFPNESHDFKVHLPVLLVQRRVLEALYGKKYTEKVIKNEMKIEDLNLVWPIANNHYKKFKTYKKGIINFIKEI